MCVIRSIKGIADNVYKVFPMAIYSAVAIMQSFCNIFDSAFLEIIRLDDGKMLIASYSVQCSVHVAKLKGIARDTAFQIGNEFLPFFFDVLLRRISTVNAEFYDVFGFPQILLMVFRSRQRGDFLP